MTTDNTQPTTLDLSELDSLRKRQAELWPRVYGFGPKDHLIREREHREILELDYKIGQLELLQAKQQLEAREVELEKADKQIAELWPQVEEAFKVQKKAEENYTRLSSSLGNFRRHHSSTEAQISSLKNQIAQLKYRLAIPD